MGIYIIRAKNGPVKIGFTDRCPHARLSNIATAHWAEMKLVAFMDGDHKAEKELHRRFASARIRGEWFDVTPEIEEFIKQCPKPPKKQNERTNIFADKTDDELDRLQSIWFDLSIPSNNRAGQIAGVHYHTLARFFGPSGREGRSAYEQRKQAAIDTARKRTDDGRCSPERLFELWGSPADIREVVSKSGWPQATIYRHFKLAGISREMARLEMANRRKAKRSNKTKR